MVCKILEVAAYDNIYQHINNQYNDIIMSTFYCSIGFFCHVFNFYEKNGRQERFEAMSLEDCAQRCAGADPWDGNLVLYPWYPSGFMTNSTCSY